MHFPYGETLVLHGRVLSGQDGDGNDVYGDGDPVVLTNVPVWPSDGNSSGANEQTNNRDTVVVGLAALLPPGTDAEAIDYVTTRGHDYEIVGEPGIYQSPFTGLNPGVLINLRRVTG